MSSWIFEPIYAGATPSILVVRYCVCLIATVIFAIFELAVASAFVALLAVVVSAFVALFLACTAVIAFVAILGLLRLAARVALHFRVIRVNKFLLRSY